MSSGNLEPDRIAQLRRDYSQQELKESEVSDNPISQFMVWMEQALTADLMDANAMTLSTVDRSGAPSSRIVLLKGVDEDGFRFYTNYSSRKAGELKENPRAALCFYWAPLERQVRIEGRVTQLTREESEAYFKQRPRLSQLGAWASQQSREVSSRKEMEARFAEIKKRFEGDEVPLPEFWGGYILNPSRIEFWQGREGRMHDRLCYEKNDGRWKIRRLYP